MKDVTESGGEVEKEIMCEFDPMTEGSMLTVRVLLGERKVGRELFQGNVVVVWPRVGSSP